MEGQFGDRKEITWEEWEKMEKSSKYQDKKAPFRQYPTSSLHIFSESEYRTV